uniref:Uncharacterized protein n=1 Tax=Coccidioides posadasii RMSCC 3488 TaxID=454284 RepID=A0A0J6FMF4_COCPO|nr:hypothetical protein CPAG_06906 [Coccidioides posadasii RMSCC 3488]
MVIEPSLLLFPENGSTEWKALLHLKRPAVKRRWPIWLASGLSAGAASVRPMGIEGPARCQFLQVRRAEKEAIVRAWVMDPSGIGEAKSGKKNLNRNRSRVGVVRKGCVTSPVPLAGWLAGWLLLKDSPSNGEQRYGDALLTGDVLARSAPSLVGRVRIGASAREFRMEEPCRAAPREARIGDFEGYRIRHNSIRAALPGTLGPLSVRASMYLIGGTGCSSVSMLGQRRKQLNVHLCQRERIAKAASRGGGGKGTVVDTTDSFGFQSSEGRGKSLFLTGYLAVLNLGHATAS